MLRSIMTRLLLISFLACGPLSSRSLLARDAEGTIQHVVIEPATNDTPRSDTASIAQLPNGQLMVVYHKYESSQRSGHDHGICRIWSKVSNDFGKT